MRLALLPVLFLLTARAHAAVKTPIPLSNVGMCEQLFTVDECRHPPKDVAMAIKNLRRHGTSREADVAKLGGRAVPALIELAGEKKLSLFVMAPHSGLIPFYWHAPYAEEAQGALLAALEADPGNPVFKRIALGPGTWFQNSVWQKLVDRQAAFSLPEVKLLLHSSFVFDGDQYGWPAILKICLRLPPEQAVEVLVDAAHTFDLANIKNLGEADWRRLDEWLDALARADSVQALYYLIRFRRQCDDFNPRPTEEAWFTSVFDRKELPSSETRPSSKNEELKAAYDRRIIPLLGKHRLSRNELELNLNTFPDLKPEGTFWRLTRYDLSIESPRRDVFTDVMIGGKPASFEDGTDWKGKSVPLDFKNTSRYAKDFSFSTVSSAPFSTFPAPLEISVTSKGGKKAGTGRALGAIIWQRKITAWDPTDDLYRPDPRVKDVVVWDFHFALNLYRDQFAYVTLLIEGEPLKDTDGVVWNRRALKAAPKDVKEGYTILNVDLTWRREPPLGHKPQALLRLQAPWPGAVGSRIIGKPHESKKSR